VVNFKFLLRATTQSPVPLAVILRSRTFSNFLKFQTLFCHYFNGFLDLLVLVRISNSCCSIVLTLLVNCDFYIVDFNCDFHNKNYAQHYIGKSRADVLKPTEVLLFSFSAKFSSRTSIPCLRQYFAVVGNPYNHSANSGCVKTLPIISALSKNGIFHPEKPLASSQVTVWLNLTTSLPVVSRLYQRLKISPS